MMQRRIAAAASAGLLLLAACGGGGDETTAEDEADATTTTTAVAEVTTTTGAPATTAAPVGADGLPAPFLVAGATMTVTPDRDLTHDSFAVFDGVGFPEGTLVGIAQCSLVVDNGPRDCHLAGGTIIPVGEGGTIHGQVRIVVGPIGADGHLCDAQNICSIGVADMESHEAYAIIPITFAG